MLWQHSVKTHSDNYVAASINRFPPSWVLLQIDFVLLGLELNGFEINHFTFNFHVQDCQNMEVQNVCKGVRYIELYGVPSPTRFHADSQDVFSTVEILGYWKLLRMEVQWHSVNDGAGVSRQIAFSMLQICYLVVCSLIFKRNVKINEISVLEE